MLMVIFSDSGVLAAGGAIAVLDGMHHPITIHVDGVFPLDAASLPAHRHLSKSPLRHDKCPSRRHLCRLSLSMHSIRKAVPMDVLEWIMLNAVVLVIAVAIYDFWRGCKGL